MIKKIFDEIANESSTLKKVEILSKYKDNDLLRDVLYLANSKRIKFYIKKIPDYILNRVSVGISLTEALQELDAIINREVTGNDAIEYLVNIFESLHEDDAYILERIIEKDCKIGMGTTFINKVFSNLIEKTPYMGALPFEETLVRELLANGQAISQSKMDGRYANAIIRGGEVEVESRQGEPTILHGAKFVKELSKFEDCVLNGELTMDNLDGTVMSRYESNGIIASLVSVGDKILNGEDTEVEIKKLKKKHNVDYHEALDKIRFTVWDMIEVDEYFEVNSKTPYNKRLDRLDYMIFDISPTMVTSIDSRIVTSYEEAINHFKELLASGNEGTILKQFDGPWKNGKHKNQIKMKLEMDVDLKITGFNYGTGKNANVISSLNATSQEGIVFTKPTGIKEDLMEYITANQDKLLDSIVEVKCCGLSSNSNGQYALLHPVFKKLRDDKSIANTFDEIVDIEKMAKGLEF